MVRIHAGEPILHFLPIVPFPLCFLVLAWFESRSFWNGDFRVASNFLSFTVAAAREDTENGDHIVVPQTGLPAFLHYERISIR